ncbi:hypothetical protein, partial [Nesterenkonia alkaliphila]|uniref:hypothetical protein n=1 Tax=Nesterenkonia alkaliphila TaxID=1463631 RepID=UPI001E451EC7
SGRGTGRGRGPEREHPATDEPGSAGATYPADQASRAGVEACPTTTVEAEGVTLRWHGSTVTATAATRAAS